MGSNIMINEFISEDYKNAETFTTELGIVKKSKPFIKNGEEYERIYIDNGGKCMFLVETITNTYVERKVNGGLPIYERKKQHDTLFWIGTEEALTVDYTLLLDAINKSEGEKKGQLQALLEKLNDERTMISGVIGKNTYTYLDKIGYLKVDNERVRKLKNEQRKNM